MTKAILTGIILIVLGCTLLVGCSAANGFDWSKLSTVKYTENTYTVEGSFQNISIEDDTANIRLLPAQDGVCKIVCEESEQITYTISVDSDTLTVRINDARKWYHHIGFFFGHTDLTVYLPESEYKTLTVNADTSDVTVPADFSFGDLSISLSTGNIVAEASVSGKLYAEASTGNISVSNAAPTSVSLSTSTGNITADTIQASGAFQAVASTGRITLSNVTCNTAALNTSTGDIQIFSLTAADSFYAKSSTGNHTFNGVTCAAATVSTTTGNQNYTDFSCTSAQLQASTGKIHMTNLVSSGHLQIQTDTGDITFDRCDATSMNIKADTGDVKGTFRTPKIIYTDTDTGKVNIPHSTEGGVCEIKTDTGDINITIAQ